MFPSFPSEQHKARALDDAPITQDRESVTSPCDYIFVEFQRKLVRCRPRDTVNVHVTSIAPTFANSFQIINSGNRYSFHACVMATWTVGADSISNPSFERAVNLDTLTSQEKCIMSGLSTASGPNLISNLQYTGVIPGDTCTLLRSAEGESDACPVIVHRYWRHEDGIPSILVLWIQTSSPQIQPHGADTPAKILDTHIVEKVKLRRSCSSIPATSRHDKARRSCYGRLADGTPYVVYRILLYCDDIQKSSQMGKGSAGGCYFLSLSLPAEKRRNTSSVRITSLTPPGVSTNGVLHFIVPHLVHSSLHGVEGHTPSGVKLRIFLDVLRFTGDYPASASVIDVIGHTGSAPCTLCSFRRAQEAETEGSRYSYTTAVHASNNAFLRHGQRHTSMRISGVSDADCNRIGLVRTDRAGHRECPLLYLQQKVEINRSSAALAHDGNLVTGGHFDAYRCNFVAADHLLTGLIKDMLNATFGSLPAAQLRTEADIRICVALRSNGLLTQREVYNMKKKSLHGMTLSELFCVLLVAVPVMKVVIHSCPPQHIIHDCFFLLKDLQTLIAYTYCWPEKDLDGQKAVDLVHTDKEAYFSDMRKISKRYVQAVDSICRKSADVKQHVNKPNLHRLIELYEHTIPAFGHVREVMELVFESAHQPLKRCIARSNNRDAHIFAVEHCVGNDWQGRLATLSRDLCQSDEERKKRSRRGIRRLLLGEQADLLDEKIHEEFVRNTDQVLEKLFTVR